MKYSKKKKITQSLKFKEDTKIKFANIDEFLKITPVWDMINNYVYELDKNNNFKIETELEDKSLKEIVSEIVNFDYKTQSKNYKTNIKTNSKNYLTELVNAFYKKFKSPHAHTLLNKISSYERLQGAFGVYTLSFGRKSNIKVQDMRKQMYNGQSFLTVEPNKTGLLILQTLIHEMQHEKQENYIYKILNNEKISKDELFTALYFFVCANGIGGYKPEYYNRYFEFDAERASFKTIKAFMENGYIENNRENKLKLYELAVKILSTVKINKVVGEQKRFARKIASDLTLFANGTDSAYDFINQYAIIETILANQPEEVKSIYNTALLYFTEEENTTKNKLELLLDIIDAKIEVYVGEDMESVDTELFSANELKKFEESFYEREYKEECKLLMNCIVSAIEQNEKVVDDKQITAGKYILTALPKKFKNVEEIKVMFNDLFDIPAIPELKNFLNFTEKDLDTYCDKIKEEYKEIENISYELQKEILNEMTKEEKEYLKNHIVSNKYGHSETYAHFLPHIETAQSFDYGKSMYFIANTLKAWKNSKLQAENNFDETQEYLDEEYVM